MNRQEFETWKAGIYESINEADSIIGLSQINKGGVGDHNNRTPSEIKKVNDRRDDLKQRVADKMKKAGEVVKNSVDAGKSAIGDTVNKAREKVAGAKKMLANTAKKVGDAITPKDITPIGLTGIKRNAEEKEAKERAKASKKFEPIGLAEINRRNNVSKKPDAPQKKPDPVNSLKNAPTGKTGSQQNKVQPTSKAQLVPTGKTGSQQNTNSNQQNKTQSASTGKATSNKADDTDDTENKTNNSNRKGIAQKLKDGAKKLAHGAFNAYYGAKYTAQDAKDWLKKAAKHAQVNQAHKRGHDRAHYEKDDDNAKSTSSNNTSNNGSASTNNTKANKSNGNTNTNSGSNGGGTNIHIRINNGRGSSSKGDDDLNNKVKQAKAGYDPDAHQARNDEDKRARADELAKAEEEREKQAQKAYNKANNKKDSSTGAKINTGTGEVKQTSNNDENVTNEVEKGSKKPKTAKKIGKEANEPKEEKVEGDLENKAENAKSKTEETKAEEKKARQSKTKAKISPKTEETKPEVKEEPKAEETKAETKPVETPKAEEKKPETKVEETPKTEEKKPETKVEETPKKKETPKIKANPNASNYRKLTDDEVQKSDAKKLPKGEAKGSHSLQHVKTKGDEESMYDDEKGNPVPAKPSDVKKDDTGERTERKAFLVKKAKEKNEEKKPEVKAEEKKPEVKAETPKAKAETKPVETPKAEEKKPETKVEPKAEEKKPEVKAEETKPVETPKAKEETKANANLDNKIKNAKDKPQQVKKELTPEEKEAKARKLQEIKAKQAQASQEAFKKRQEAMANMKGGHEKSNDEIKANNEKIRKETGATDPENEVKKQANTVSSSWRESFIKRTHADDYKDLPDDVSGHMKKYKDYWKRINTKDHEMTPEERREGDELENKLKELVGKHPDAFGKKTTVKDKKDDEVKIHRPKKIDLSSKLRKSKEDEKSDVDKFIEDNSKEDDGPTDAELKAIERAERHTNRKKK